jgi:hypothetical protein
MAYAVRLQQVHNSVVLHPRFLSNASRCIPPANPNSDSSAKTADTVRLHLILSHLHQQESSVDSSRSCNTLADFIKSTLDVHAGTPTTARCTRLALQFVYQHSNMRTFAPGVRICYSVKSLEKLGLFVLFIIISNVNLSFARHADLPKRV